MKHPRAAWLALALAASCPALAQEGPPAPPAAEPPGPPAAEPLAPPAVEPAAEPSAEDARLTAHAQRAVDVVDDSGAVEVSVRAGVAVLRGGVRSPRRRDAMGEVVRAIPGVLYVHDLLEVRPAPGDDPSADPGAARAALDEAIYTQLATIIENVDDLRDVDVDVQSGVVRLGGEVEIEEVRERAAELTAGLEGVIFVDNELVLQREVRSRVASAMDRAREQGRELLVQLPLVGVALAVLLLSWLVARLVTAWRAPFRLLADTPLVQQVIQQLVRVVILVMGAVAALEVLDLTTVVGAVLGTAGVAGLALGFAFRDIAENYLASLILSARRPFQKHDHVVIGEHEGKVVRLTTSETVLMTLDGNHLAIPNAVVFKSATLNYTRNPLRRFEFQVGVGTQEDMADALERGRETLAGLEGVLADPAPVGWVHRLGDSNVVLCFFGWIDQRAHDFLKVRSAAQRGVKLAFDAAGISMPTPIYEVVTRPHTELEATRVPEAPRPPAREEVDDVSRDDSIERQIEADRAATGEEDLLARDGGGDEGKTRPRLE